MMRLNRAWLIAVFAASFSVVPSLYAQAPGAGGAGVKVDTKASTTSPATAAKAGAAAVGTGSATKAGAGGASGTASAPSPTSTTTATASGTAATGTGVAAGTTTPTTAAPATGTAASTTAAGGTALDGSTYVVRLRDLEQRIDELKEQIRRSHTRLSLLSDTILSGGVGGARAEVVFKNDLSNAFRLTGAIFVLDGVVQYNKQDESDAGLLASQKEIPIFSGSIPPGDHTLQVVLRLRGHGYGVFSYLRGYKFETKSSHLFTVTEGKTVAIETIAWEKGDVTTPLEQRPAVRYTENVRTGMADAAAPASKTAPAAPAQGSVSGGLSVGAGGK
jgi:hypothetical protein